MLLSGLRRGRIGGDGGAVESRIVGKGNGWPGRVAIGKRGVGWQKELVVGLGELGVERLGRGQQGRGRCNRLLV